MVFWINAALLVIYLDELYIKLKEVLDLCLEEMDSDEINTIPEFVKIEEIELV